MRCLESYREGLVLFPNRYVTFRQAFDLLEERSREQGRSPIIVETGCMRMDEFSDGKSSLLFAEFLAEYGSGELYSLDIDPHNIEFARSQVQSRVPGVSATFITGDSLQSLGGFPHIDFLYLDSVDAGPGMESAAAWHNLKELFVAEPALDDCSIILIDDCGGGSRGKGRYSTQYLDHRGWRCLACLYQTLWIRG